MGSWMMSPGAAEVSGMVRVIWAAAGDNATKIELNTRSVIE